MQLNVHELVALRELLELVEYSELANLDGITVIERLVREKEATL